MTELKYPSEDTWFICWDNGKTEIKVYASVSTTQCMVTPWDEVDYYTDEAVWLAILLENGIDPNE